MPLLISYLGVHMRTLRVSDLTPAVKFIKEAGLKDSITKATEEGITQGKTNRQVGIDIMFAIVTDSIGDERNAKALYKFLSGPMECDPEEIEEMSIAKLFENLQEIADIAEWRSFFETAGKSMNLVH